MTTHVNSQTAANNLSVRILNDRAFFNNSKLASHVLSNLNVMRKQGLFCDVSLEIQCSDDLRKTRIPAHACVLASGSQLFYDVLDRETKNRQVLLKSFDESILNICLDYMYGQQVIIQTQQLPELSAASSTLKIKSLASLCTAAQTAIANAGVESMDHLIVMRDSENINEPISPVKQLNVTDSMLDLLSSSTQSLSSTSMGYAEEHTTLQEETIGSLNSSTGETEIKDSPSIPTSSTGLSKQNNSMMEFAFQDAFTDTSNKRDKVDDYVFPSVSGLASSQETVLNIDKHSEHQNNTNKQNMRKPITVPKAVLKIKGNSVALKDLPPEIRKVLKCPERSSSTPREPTSRSQSSGKNHKTPQQLKHSDSKVIGIVSIVDQISTISNISGNESLLPENYVGLTPDTHNASVSYKPDQKKGTKQEPEWVYKHRVQPMKCDHCDRMFAGVAGLKEHKKRVAKNPNLRVPPRTKEERKLKNRLRHQRQRDKIYTCEECGVQLKGWHTLFKHRRVNHNTTLFCKYCSKAFAYPNQLKVHESRHRKDKNFMCSFCEYHAVTKKEVEYHEQVQHLDIRFPCPECKVVFKCDMYLQRHIRTVHKKGPIKCKYCDYSCASNSYLKNHVLNKHFPDKRQPWHCDVCNKQFTNKGHLDRHLKDVHRTAPTPKRYYTVNSNQPLVNQDMDMTETFPISSTASAIDQGDFQVDSPVLKQGLGDFVGYLRTDDGTVLRVNNSNVKFEDGTVFEAVDNSDVKIEESNVRDISQDQVQTGSNYVAAENLIASGVHVEAKEEVIYYEDDTYI